MAPAGVLEWRCQPASLWQATRLAGECPDPQQVGRESLDGEEWEPPELKYGDGGDEDGEGTPSRRRRKLEPELASAPDRGLDAQPVLVPDQGLDGLAVKRRTALSLGARGESRGRREQVQYGGLARRGERAAGGTGGAWM